MADIVDILVPEHELEGTVSMIESWLARVGDAVRQHEPLLEINTDKVTVEIPAPATGTLVEILRQVNEEVKPGDLIGRIAVSAAAAESQSAAKVASIDPIPDTAGPTTAPEELSPAVKRLVRKHGLDISKIAGSGRGGRVTVEDIELHLAEKEARGEGRRESEIPHRMVPHNQLRLQTARHMVESMLRTAPHVTAVHEADLSAVIAHRDRTAPEFERRGVKLTYTAYFVQAAARALVAVPEVNSRWHHDALEMFTECHIGIAAAVEEGLVVPVVRSAQSKDIFQIAKDIQDLTARARASRLLPADVQNGTFTITNHGAGGSLIATPIISQPQSAILGIGKVEKRPVVVQENGADTIVIRPMLYVTLTIDHRVLDGFKANVFLTAFTDALRDG